MSDEPQLLYLEPDDEITSVVRRVRGTEAARVVLVAPGRARATSSAVALRLLARVADEESRQLAVVGDALTRSLAGEAGLPAYAVVGDARDGLATAPVEEQRARIHVVRGDEATAEQPAVESRARSQPTADHVTREVPVAVPPTTRATSRRRRRVPAVALAALLALLLAAGAAGAVLLPSASVAITPEARTLGPVEYAIAIVDPATESGTLTASVTGTASGSYQDLAPASGEVVFHNFNTVAVEVGGGTQVAAGEVVFRTVAPVVVPRGTLTADGRISSGDTAVQVVAEVPGPLGNLPAESISTILNEAVAASLRGFAENQLPLVAQPAATAGGVDASGPVIEQADVDAAVKQLRVDLAAQFEEVRAPDHERLYAPSGPAPEPVIEVPEGLIGTRDQASFELTGTLEYSRPYAQRDEVEDEARERLLANDGLVPGGHDLLEGSIEVTLGEARLDGERLVVDATVSAAAAPEVDPAVIRARIAGMDPDAAQAALAHLGRVRVDVWPAWARQVPTLDWRIEVSVGELERAER